MGVRRRPQRSRTHAGARLRAFPDADGRTASKARFVATTAAITQDGAPSELRLSPALDRRFEAIVFDWDGTAVPDRQADAGRVRELVEALCAHGMNIGIVTGTHVGNVDGQLQARPPGPGRLYLSLNRGPVLPLLPSVVPLTRRLPRASTPTGRHAHLTICQSVGSSPTRPTTTAGRTWCPACRGALT